MTMIHYSTQMHPFASKELDFVKSYTYNQLYNQLFLAEI